MIVFGFGVEDGGVLELDAMSKSMCPVMTILQAD
jgi:hypothetical protein